LVFPELGKLGIEVCLARVRDDPEILGLVARRPIACVKLGHDLTAAGSAGGLREIVASYHQRGARVIAAGIENPEAVGRVWSSGVDYIQGNYIQFPEESPSFDFQDTLLESMV
jgi:EAL domain-containing protein (putative c-di-GMP-specific phosphodiesterase class I)